MFAVLMNYLLGVKISGCLVYDGFICAGKSAPVLFVIGVATLLVETSVLEHYHTSYLRS